MRLIDAEELIALIRDQKEKETGAYTKGINHGLNIVKSIICDGTQTPTAYDVNAVVEQLEDRTSFLKDCLKHGNQTKSQKRKSYETMMMYEVSYLVDDLIDIVKGGGVDE